MDINWNHFQVRNKKQKEMFKFKFYLEIIDFKSEHGCVGKGRCRVCNI
jgi:hypothetical protein